MPHSPSSQLSSSTTCSSDSGGRPDVVCALSLSSSRFSASFNDGLQSQLRLVKRAAGAANTPLASADSVDGVKITTGVAMTSSTTSSGHAAVVAVETHPLIALEGTQTPSGRATHNLITALAERIADRLLPHVSPSSHESGVGEEVVTYALGHTNTGKTSFLLGAALPDKLDRRVLQRDADTTNTTTTTADETTAGLLECVLNRLFAPGTEKLPSLPIVALSVLEVSERPELTQHVRDALLPLRDDDVTATDLVSGRRGQLLRPDLPDGPRTPQSSLGRPVHAFLDDPADIPAAQYVRVTSSAEAMTVLRRCCAQAQSWAAAPSRSDAPPRPRTQAAGDGFFDHIVITVLVGAAVHGETVPTSVWKLWDFTGPPPIPITANAPVVAVPGACWGWPRAVRQRLHDLAQLPTQLDDPDAGNDHATTAPQTAATPLVQSVLHSASLVVVLGALLHDVCADGMNAYTLRHLSGWSQDQSPRPHPGAHVVSHTRADRAARRMENLEAAQVALRSFTVPIEGWHAHLEGEAARATRVETHDARRRDLALPPLHADLSEPNAQLLLPDNKGDSVPVLSAASSPPLASACGLHYTRDLSTFSGIHLETDDGTEPLSDAAIAAAEVAALSAVSTNDQVSSPPVNRAAQAAKAAARFEDDSRRRFPHPRKNTETTPTTMTTPITPALRVSTPPAQLLDAPPDAAALETTSDTPLARASPPPSATAQTERPDTESRRTQQGQTDAHANTMTVRGAALFLSRLTIDGDDTTKEEEEGEGEGEENGQQQREDDDELGAQRGTVDALRDWSPAEWRTHIHRGLEPSLSTIAPSQSAAVEAAVWRVVAPLIEQCVQSTKVAKASRAAWEDERTRTHDLVDRMARLERQINLLLTQRPASAVPEPAEDGVDLPMPVSPIQHCHDRSLSTSQTLSTSISAGQAAQQQQHQEQLAHILARSVVCSPAAGRRATNKAGAAHTPQHAWQGDKKSASKPGPEVASPLFDIELTTPERPAQGSGHPWQEALSTARAERTPADHRSKEQTLDVSSGATVRLELQLADGTGPGVTQRAALVPAAGTVAAAAPAAAGQLDNDSTYPVAEVEALRKATSAVQDCALTVLASELSRGHVASSSRTELSNRDPEPWRTPDAHTHLEGFVETPEKAQPGPVSLLVASSLAEPVATRMPFSPQTLQAERKLYDAVSAMQSASVAVEERARRAAEREMAYLQTVLLASCTPAHKAQE